ncbi:MAG: hypothetical protein ACOCWI_02655 [Bacillota bacterium]
MKKINIIVLSVLIILVLSVLAYVSKIGYANIADKPHLPEVENLSLDEVGLVDGQPGGERAKLYEKSTGLFYYEGDEARSVLEDNLDIDPTKPIVIFTHGMLYDGGYDMRLRFREKDIWQDAGYNAFVFRWSQLSDDIDFNSIEKKIWTRADHPFAYKDEFGKRQVAYKKDCYSVAEIFGAFYNEFMTNYDINAPEIRFLGHSMGGDLAMGVSSYIYTLVDKGVMEDRFMFTRVVMLDPFVSSMKNEMYVPWLDKTVAEEGSARLYVDVINKYKEIGIAVEYIHSGYADILGDKQDIKLLEEAAAFIKVDSSYIEGSIDDVIANRHQVAVDWYSESMEYKYWDSSVANLNYAMSASVPTPFVGGQFGGIYKMVKNTTRCVCDDEIYSTGFDSARIVGYAFKDTNNNGIMDGSFATRYEGVKVKLYNNDILISTKLTNRGGFYRFNLDESYVGKELHIVTEDITPTKVNLDETICSSYKNSINEDLKSSKFTLNHKNQIFVKNIGIK